MNGIHDMGGMHGFGKIDVRVDEPVFEQRWHGRVYAMAMYTPQAVPGGFRYMIEKLPAVTYLSYSYYEKWLYARLQGMLDSGAISASQMREKIALFNANPAAVPTVARDPEATRKALSRPRPVPARRELSPIYDVGAQVRARNIHPPAHTRLPRYVRGRRCTIDAHLGDWSVDDTPADGESRAVEPLYRVRFEASELWGDAAEANSALYIDMWQSYLQPL